MAEKIDPRRTSPRRVVGGLDLFCYRAATSVLPQSRSNIGRELEDISPGGARIKVSEPLPEGESLTIELKDRRSGESFRARGEVRWCETLLAGVGQSHFIGIQFKEHYSPVELRDRFTLGSARFAGVSAPVATAVDKRKASRFHVDDYVVTCIRQGTLSGGGLKRNIGREVLDLSASGVQISVLDKLDPGALVLFTLHFNAFGDQFESLAAVRWCKPDPSIGGDSYRIGLEFLRLPEQGRKKIEFVRTWFEKRRHRK